MWHRERTSDSQNRPDLAVVMQAGAGPVSEGPVELEEDGGGGAGARHGAGDGLDGVADLAPRTTRD